MAPHSNPHLSTRRDVLAASAGLTAASVGLIGSAAAAPKGAPSRVPDTSTPQRAHAAKALTGMANLMFPSFKPDLETLDDEGLAQDVTAAMDQGFCATMPMINWTLPGTPSWQTYLSAIMSAAKGRHAIHGVIGSSTAEADIAQLRALEKLGVDMVLLAPRFPADIEADALYAALAERVQATELPIILYAANNAGRYFPHLGPSGLPIDVFDRLADLPNVVSVKVSQPISLTSHRRLAEVLGDRLLIAPVNLDFVPLLARHHHIQWSGQWNAEAVQTPDHQLANKLLNAAAAGDIAAMDEAAAKIQALHEAFFDLQSSVVAAGAHPYQHNKYFSWLGGGNGGLVPIEGHADAVPVLTKSEREAIRARFIESGLTPTSAAEESFPVGRAAFARGRRIGDLAATPKYEV